MPKVFAFLLGITFLALAAPDPAHWEAGIKALQEDRPKEAIEALSQWIQQAESASLKVPEAHYNLGIAHWSAEDPEKAMQQLLTASALRNFPWESWGDFNTMGLMQRELGFPDNPADTLQVRTTAFFTRNTFLLLLLGGLWALCLYAFLRPKTNAHPFLPLILFLFWVQVVFLTTGVVIYKYSGILRIVAKQEPLAVLHPLPTDDTDKDALIELPAGTLVLTDSVSGEFLHVKLPVPGWIHQDSLSTG